MKPKAKNIIHKITLSDFRATYDREPKDQKEFDNYVKALEHALTLEIDWSNAYDMVKELEDYDERQNTVTE